MKLFYITNYLRGTNYRGNKFSFICRRTGKQNLIAEFTHTRVRDLKKKTCLFLYGHHYDEVNTIKKC